MISEDYANPKKIILINLAIIASFQAIIAQEKSELDLITSDKWYLDFFENCGSKKDIMKN